MTLQPADERRRRIRRNVWLLVGVAVAFYAGFILLAISTGHA